MNLIFFLPNGIFVCAFFHFSSKTIKLNFNVNHVRSLCYLWFYCWFCSVLWVFTVCILVYHLLILVKATIRCCLVLTRRCVLCVFWFVGHQESIPKIYTTKSLPSNFPYCFVWAVNGYLSRSNSHKLKNVKTSVKAKQQWLLVGNEIIFINTWYSIIFTNSNKILIFWFDFKCGQQAHSIWFLFEFQYIRLQISDAKIIQSNWPND